MLRRASLAIVIVGLLGLITVVGPVSAANRGVRVGEADERYFFSPKTQYANVGDTVTWTNGTDVTHTINSDSGSELDSGDLVESATFEHTFGAEGTFAYHCTVHDYMKATIIVLAAGAALPATDTVVGPVGQPDSGGNGWFPIALLASLAAGGVAIRRFHPVTES